MFLKANRKDFFTHSQISLTHFNDMSFYRDLDSVYEFLCIVRSFLDREDGCRCDRNTYRNS